jgi:hypothetical protein
VVIVKLRGRGVEGGRVSAGHIRQVEEQNEEIRTQTAENREQQEAG